MSKFEDHLSEQDKAFYKKLHIGEDVSRPMQTHSATIFRLGVMMAETEVAMDSAEFGYKKVEMQLIRDFRNQDKNNKIKSTENQLTERARTHSMYCKAYESYLESKKLHLVVKTKYKAQLEKGSMLQQLANNRRKELDAGIRSTLKSKSSE